MLQFCELILNYSYHLQLHYSSSLMSLAGPIVSDNGEFYQVLWRVSVQPSVETVVCSQQTVLASTTDGGHDAVNPPAINIPVILNAHRGNAYFGDACLSETKVRDGNLVQVPLVECEFIPGLFL